MTSAEAASDDGAGNAMAVVDACVARVKAVADVLGAPPQRKLIRLPSKACPSTELAGAPDCWQTSWRVLWVDRMPLWHS